MLQELFGWAVAQAEAADHPAPTTIHVGSNFPPDSSLPLWRERGKDKEGHRAGSPSTIFPAPFTTAFVRWVDDDEQKAPIEKALDALYSPRDKRQSLEFEIAYAVVKGGHTDLSVVCSVLGDPADFNPAAVNALALLKQKTLEHAHDQMRAVHGNGYKGDRALA